MLARKITVSVLSTVLLSASALPVSAFALNSPTASTSSEYENEYVYDYQGVTFRGNVPLSDEQLASMFKALHINTKNSAQKVGSDKVDPGGPGSEIVIGPMYHSYNNQAAREAAHIIIAFLASKSPKTAPFSWVFSRLSGWADSTIKDTYVGAWQWRVPDGKWDIYYDTIVHYKDDTYRRTLDVQYYEVDRKRR
ncbi:Stress protein [Brevibacillus sp. IT-7CA2]|uniref:hypothetical protein n=1 Tax=Brevibacillus sp. IT-7CA2 TaxID=3026436 RepID=UPI0039E01422